MSKLGWIVRVTLKAAALLGGLTVTVVCLMAVLGLWIDNGWARAAIAIVVALLVPALLADRALARLSPDRMSGVTSDVIALTYMGFVVAFVVAGHSATRPLLQIEGARLAESGRDWTSRLAYTLAGDNHPRAPTRVEQASVATAPAAAQRSDKPSGDGLRKPDAKERTPAQIFNEFAPSVVTINVVTPMGDGGGTGFVVDNKGTIGTNHHVIEQATEITVKLMDGTVIKDVEILTVNEPQDLALLRVNVAKLPPAVMLGDSDKVMVGERAVSIGNPLGLEHTLTDGVLSARRVIQGRKMIQMSTPVSPGNSGGPLFNSRGEVIGVSTAIYAGGSPFAQNLNLAMPINELKTMIKSEYLGRHKAGAGARSERW
jgi:serine protease Do